MSAPERLLCLASWLLRRRRRGGGLSGAEPRRVIAACAAPFGRVARAVLLARGSPDRRRPRRRPTSGRPRCRCGKLHGLPAGSTPVTCTYFTSHRPSADAHRARARRDRYTRFCYHYGANGALCPWLRPTWCACRPAGRAHSPLAPGVPHMPRPARPEPRPARPDRSSWPLHTHCRSTIARGRGRSRWRVGWMCCADRSVRLSLHRLRPPRLGL